MERGSPTPCLLLSSGISCKALERASWSDLPREAAGKHLIDLGRDEPQLDMHPRGHPSLLPLPCRLLCVSGTVAADGPCLQRRPAQPLWRARWKVQEDPLLGSGPNLPWAPLRERPYAPCQAQKRLSATVAGVTVGGKCR